mmetsp:Transcript_724/g.1126  ORF Transcript_724/g.1126 Transcript_724/m.1126 type:complete len:85 (-) Transcript_724:100-354(-)
MAHLKLRRIPVLLSLFLINFLEFTSSYNVYNYDLTTPLFTPDGLLKQVEYAAAAPTHQQPPLDHGTPEATADTGTAIAFSNKFS